MDNRCKNCNGIECPADYGGDCIKKSCNHTSEIGQQPAEDMNGNCYFCGKSLTAMKLGSIKTKKKAKASRENGKKGGRPRKTFHETKQ